MKPRRLGRHLLYLFVILALVLPGPAAAATGRAPNEQSPTANAAEDVFINVAASFGAALGGNDWDPTDATTRMTDDNGDGVWKFTATIPIGNWEYKVADGGSWDVAYPANNVSLSLSEAKTVTFYYRRADHTVHDSVNQCVATVAGNFQSELGGADWSPDSLVSWMTDPDGDGTYEFTAEIPAGSWEYKVALNEGWSESYPGSNVSLNLPDASLVTFRYNCGSSAVDHTVRPLDIPKPDDNIWWDGLGHNSRDDLYRTPGGAVTTGVPVTVRLRTFHNDVTGVTLRVWSTVAGRQTLLPMTLVASTDDEPYGYDYWEATIPAQDEPTVLWYRFIVRDGADEDYYEDDDLFDGGWGAVYEDSPDYSFQIDVYEAGFDTPDWMKNAVVYQIFPDRFFNGDLGNDPSASDPTVYGEDVLVKAWGDEPEGYCRSYVGVTCTETPQGRDFFGGDLEGIRQKLGYLKGLGVTAVYLNPIFQSPTNHLYDTTDYTQIDPYFGSNATFQKFLQQADKLGIHVILDGVFNHTSSDSLYFDRYSRYSAVGAYESEDSPYSDWYTFSNWPEDYNSWWGFDSMPVLTEVPAVREFIYGADDSVARRWIDMGAAGWRLDVAPDKSHDWWEEFRTQVKDADPDAVIIGEIWDDASDWLLGDEFDSTMNYRFRRALLGFLDGDSTDPNQGAIRGLNPDQFDAALQSIQEDYPPAAAAAAMNLVGTHDTQRILWALTPGASNPADKELDEGNLAEGKAKLELLAILQMTLPGAPTIYYGDEAGMTGDTDPDCRRPYPWGAEDTALQDHYRKLIQLRDANSFLRTGSYDRLYTSNGDGTYAYGRKDATGAAVVAVNRDTQAHSLTIPVGGYIPEGTTLTDALNGGSYRVSGGAVTVDVRGRWGAVLITRGKVDLTPPAAPANLEATVGDSRVDLSWNAASDASGYNIYRSVVRGGGYVRLNDAPVAGTNYTDDSAANGQVFYYVVTAADTAGNESGRSNEVEALPHLVIGWANLQWPPTLNHVLSALSRTDDVYGQVWIDGQTDQPGATEGLIAQVGYGPAGTKPASNADWVWTDAVFNTDVGNNDEFKGSLLPEATGTFAYCYRYSTLAGREWVYADTSGIVSPDAVPSNMGVLTVTAPDDTTAPGAPADLRLLEASGDHLRLAWDAPADADLFRYEVLRSQTAGEPYTKVANVPASGTEYTDWSVGADASYYYVVRAVDTSFNRSGDSNELAATAAPREVQVTFSVTVPDWTPAGDTVYVAGNFQGWAPSATPMTSDNTNHWTVTIALSEGYQLEYKYTLGSWDNVEKGPDCEEISNRPATVTYGAGGAMTIDDTVPNWRGMNGCPS